MTEVRHMWRIFQFQSDQTANHISLHLYSVVAILFLSPWVSSVLNHTSRVPGDFLDSTIIGTPGIQLRELTNSRWCQASHCRQMNV